MASENIRIKYTVDSSELEQSNKELKEAQKQNNLTQKEVDETTDKYKKQGKTLGGLNGTMKKVGITLAAVFAADQIIDFAKGVVTVTGNFQKMEAVLKNTLGSNSKAQKALKDIQNFAAKTPFAVSELTNSFVKLANQGFVPTINQMRKLGDLAASTGKSFDDLTEAVIDAQVGEFERLKEFGIRASKQGDQVKFTFKGVEKQVKFTSDAIQEYVLSLGDIKGVSGSTAAISATIAGKISNLGDNFENLQKVIGDSNSGLIGGMLTLANEALSSVATAIDGTNIDKIREEQTELNVLVTALQGANISQESRNKLIEDITEIYPNFLKGLDTEKVTNEELEARLEGVNTQYEKRIKLMVKQEALADVNKKLVDSYRQESEVRIKISEAEREDATRTEKRNLSRKQENLNKILAARPGILKEIAAQTKLVDEALKISEEDPLAKEDDADGSKAKAAAKAAKAAADEAKRVSAIEGGVKAALALAIEVDEFDEEAFDNRQSRRELQLESIADELEQEYLLNEENEARILELKANSAETQKQFNEEVKQNKIQGALTSLALIQDIAGKESEIGKVAAIAQISIDTIQGANRASKDYKYPFNLIVAGLVTAQGSIAAGRVASVNPKFEKGGRIDGNLHSRGGTVIEAERDEFVMSRKATSKYGFNVMDKINNLELNPEILNGKTGGTSTNINLDTTPIAKQLKRMPQNNITFDEHGMTVSQRRNNMILNQKAERYST